MEGLHEDPRPRKGGRQSGQALRGEGAQVVSGRLRSQRHQLVVPDPELPSGWELRGWGFGVGGEGQAEKDATKVERSGVVVGEEG